MDAQEVRQQIKLDGIDVCVYHFRLSYGKNRRSVDWKRG